MTGATPGPWAVEGGAILDARRNVVAVRYSSRRMNDAGDEVRDLTQGGSMKDAIGAVEADANARLIASSPSLLAACERIDYWLTHEGYDLPNAGSMRAIVRRAIKGLPGICRVPPVDPDFSGCEVSLRSARGEGG